MSAEIRLGYSTYEGGKTWLARVGGTDAKFGLERDFINTVEKDMNKSGKTGTYTYLVEDGVYEGREGEKSTFYIVRGATKTKVDRDAALAALNDAGELKPASEVVEGTLTGHQAFDNLGCWLRLTTAKSPDGYVARVDGIFLSDGQPTLNVHSIERPNLARVGLHVITSWQPV